jgi:hypothetical protein
MFSRLRPVFFGLAIIGVIVLIGSFVVSSIITQNAVLAQRVEIQETGVAALFGTENEVGKPIGSPQRLIINDQKAFLEKTGENGLRYVSDKYLKDNNIYPLQALTVEFFRNITAIIAGLGAMVMLGLWRLTKPKA